MSNVVQRSFAGGELAPALYARTDQIKYATGLRTCRNFQVMRHGGVENRPGTDFVCEVKDSTKLTRLLKFVFNDTQTYILEFGDLYMRVIKNGGQIEASPGVPYEIVTPYLATELAALQYVQSADVVTIVHPNHAPANLSRLSDTNWTLTAITFAPGIAAPTGLGVSGSGAVAQFYWAVTAVNDATGEESLPVQIGGTSSPTPDVVHPVTVGWTGPVGATSYNVYRGIDGATFGYIGSSLTTTFLDQGPTPNTALSPPRARNPFPPSGDDYPSTAGYYQQRRLFANTIAHPETVYASRSANFNNFTTSTPSQDDDAVTFTLAGSKVNAVQHLVDLGKLLVMTTGSIWSVEGNGDGVLLPTAINLHQQSYHGASGIAPILLGTTLLYVQARGTVVRDLQQDPISGYRGNDLTIFSAHLFDLFSIVDWDYQEIPHSIVWLVRNDGTLLGLTYVPEQALWGWHRHDTDGVYESVCSIPDGNTDSVYVIVRRTINGASKRYIERFSNRLFSSVLSAALIDCSLTYDGRNTGTLSANRIGLVNGSAWDETEVIQLNANSNQFVADDVGNAIFFTASDGSELRCSIESYVSSTEVFVRPNRTVPLDLRDTGVLTWAKAVDRVAGLDHLEGKQVSVFADGFVVASPNNSAYTVLTVTGGVVTLEQPYATIRVGLPYISDFETLDIDVPQGSSLKDKRMNVQRVGLFVQDSRGVFAGRQLPKGDDPLEGLLELKIRSDEEYDDPVALATDFVDIDIESNWNSNGRIAVRQVDPLPLTILSATPQGYLPVGG